MTVTEMELPVVKFSVQDAAIEQLRHEYMPLTIEGIEDKEGYQAVHEARMTIKKKRVSVEKTRKALKADAIAYGRKVDDEAKRLTAMLTPIEQHLQAEEDRVEGEKERIRQEAERKRREKLESRLNQLVACGWVGVSDDVAAMDDTTFATFLEQQQEAKRKRDAEEARLAEERRKQEEVEAAERAAREKAQAERRRKEQEKLAAERAELKKLRDEQQAERQRIEAKKRQLAAEENALQRKADEERRRKEAEERARCEEEERKQREAERQARIEALKPDHEKLRAVADAVEKIEVPPVSDNDDAKEARESVLGVLHDASGAIRLVCDDLLA